MIPVLWTRWSSRIRQTHQSRNNQCSHVDYSSAGCRNLVCTGHSELPSRSPEWKGTGRTGEMSDNKVRTGESR